MNTQVLQAFDPSKARDMANISRAAELLKGGGLVIIPTETVYGLGANALDAEAVAGIFAAKGRPADNPLIAHIAALEDMAPLVAEIPERARLLAEAFWPGPLTMVLPKSGLVPGITSGGLVTVGVRMPSHPVARAIITMSGVPVAAPSANRSGSPSPTSAEHCVKDMTGRVDMIIDGGPCEVGVESTVITLAQDTPRLLRPGAVTLAELREVLGEVEADPAITCELEAGKSAPSPGMKYRHYAPRARLTLVHGEGEALRRFREERRGEGAVFLLNSDSAEEPDVIPLGGDAREQARRLFAALRELDERGAEVAYAQAPKPEGLGLAVYNRLLRAAAFRETYLKY